MLRHKNIDRVCCIVLAATILLTCCFMGAAATGLISGERSLGYEERLFDQSRVHTIDIVMDDWEEFLTNCTNEEYAACSVAIDGENIGSAGIRAKGNTSLSSVRAYGNDRYSFKIEFDQYQPGKTYHGLDKLSLNNLIQDKTYLKDYLAYTLMNKMGVAAPLCSFVQINVNGEPWGLYLAVEAVEDSFLSRNYGSDHGELYKPDSTSFGGGRGNGRAFDMSVFEVQPDGNSMQNFGRMPMSEGGDSAGKSGMIPFEMPGGFDPTKQMQERDFNGAGGRAQADGNPKAGGFGGMGSGDVMLQYIDDQPSSYPNIFNNAKTDITESDQKRLIESLKRLSEGTEIDSAVDVESVIRYLVVHNFLCNGDSYTGGMVHNYYLYEEDGVLSMIPWDYNLAFGAFSMGGKGMSSGATEVVNSPIDSPVSSGDIRSRPMISWIFENEEYTERYHELYADFISGVFDSGWMAEELNRLREMLAPYVQAEDRRFFSNEEFQQGIETLQEFCRMRAESITGQLEGRIPSTTEAQRENPDALVDASEMDLNDMGEFGMGGRFRSMMSSDGFPMMKARNAEPEENPSEKRTQAADDVPGRIQNNTEKVSGDQAEKVQIAGSAGDVRQFLGARTMRTQEAGTVGAGRTENLGILLGCSVILLASILLVKFFKVNR